MATGRRGGICRKRTSPVKRSYFFETEEVWKLKAGFTYELVEEGRDCVGQGEDSQDQEVHAEEEVDVLFAEHLQKLQRDVMSCHSSGFYKCHMSVWAHH